MKLRRLKSFKLCSLTNGQVNEKTLAVRSLEIPKYLESMEEYSFK
jgi:hypothetical protein